MRYAALPGLLFLVIFAAMTCGTLEVKNSTSESVFVNQASKDAAYDYAGQLVQPGTSISFDYWRGSSLRVRNLAGQTIYFAYGGPSKADSVSFDVSSLEPDPSAPPLGRPYYEILGYGSPWSATVCDDGSERNVPFYGMLVKVRNQSDRPLVVSLYERFADTTEEQEITGFLAPPGEEIEVFGDVLLKPWLRAVDVSGSGVYAARLGYAPTHRIEIPAELQTPPEIPRQEIHRGIAACRGATHWTDWVVIGAAVLLLLAVVLVFAFFAFLWMGTALLSLAMATIVFILTAVVELVT